jgi:hypothetical protein
MSKNFQTRRSFYVLCFKFLYNYFLKFVIHKMNSEMVKSGMVLLSGREKSDMADVDVAMS